MGLLSGFFKREQKIHDVHRDLFEKEAQRLRAQDPDTARQWLYLRAALQNQPATARVARTPRPALLFRPAAAFGLVAMIAFILGGVLWLNRTSALTYETGKGEQS